MVTKCHPGYSDTSVIQLCTNPGLDASVDSVLPATLVTTNEVFRNKFCVLCNNIDLRDNILYWSLDIYADGFIKFPETNLLNRIKSNRENVFFTPPKFVSNEPCYMPAYTISKCNETGLWDVYDEETEVACNSFIDPYNHTYKNIFCYKCNREVTLQVFFENEHCDEEPTYEGENPGFIAAVSRDTVLGYNSDEQLLCDTNQFYDRESVSRSY